MATALELTAAEKAAYQLATRRRHNQEQQALAARENRAWALARSAADLLRSQFGANRVVVFGSLVHEGLFTEWSDIDLAAWGIHPTDTFRAMGAVLDIDADIKINLVDVEACSASLRATIERDGRDL